MKLTTKGRCGLRAMIELTLNPDTRLSVKEISKRQDLSVRYLEQVFSILKKEKFIDGTKGPTGGYKLTKDPRDISIGDIIFAVEGRNRFNQKTEFDDVLNDEMAKIWQELDEKIESFLTSKSLFDLASDYKLKSDSKYMYYI